MAIQGRVPDLKAMLKTGELRHQIIKDHHKKDLNLKSIDFAHKYNIQDIISSKGQGKIDFSSAKKPKKNFAKCPKVS